MVTTETRPKANTINTNIVNVRVDHIIGDPEQPRRTFDLQALRELADSMADSGLLQPIVIRPRVDDTTKEKRYILIAGERRWRAAQMLNWDTVPAIVRRTLSDSEAAKLQLLENITREDLNPIEEAQAMGRMVQQGYTVAELSACIGTPPNIVAYKLNLLNLREDIQFLVSKGQVSSGVAHSLVKLSHDGQGRVLKAMTDKDLTVAQIRALCDRFSSQENEVEEKPFFELLTEEQQVKVNAFAATFQRAAGMMGELGNMDQANIDGLAAALSDQAEVWAPQIRQCVAGLGKLLKAMERQEVYESTEGV